MWLPPQALEIAKELGDRALDRGAWSTTFVLGEPGTGKSTVLDRIAEHIEATGRPCLRMSPTSSDLDGPANALAQAAAGMRELRINGVLDPILDPRASFSIKRDALVRGLRSAPENTVVLLDIPDSWARPSRQSRDGGTFSFQGHELIHDVLACGHSHRIVCAAARRLEGIDAESVSLERGHGDELLATIEWGPCRAAAESLPSIVAPPILRKLTPLELRVAVALRELDVDPRVISNCCRAGWPELRRMLGGAVRVRDWLNEAFFVLSHIRVAVGPKLLLNLLDICTGDDEPASRRLLMHTLLMPGDERLVFHARLREVETRLDDARAHELAEHAHRRLAGAWESLASRSTWQGMVAWWESLHHWAASGDEARLDDIPDTSMWTTLGRTRSLRGDYETAVRAFRRALDLQPSDSYAHEYLAFNLDRLDRDLVEAEQHFRRAVELDPENPWWNRRLVEALQRRGKSDTAWEAWLATLEQLGDIAAPSEWLQRNLHWGVCRGFLARGQTELAAGVLEGVPRDTWIDELARLWNTVCHRREADILEAAVFPEYLEFETRWSGPRLGGDEARPHRWFPGRIVAIDEHEVLLELAEPPSRSTPPQVVGLELDRSDFFEQANLPRNATVRVGTFLELHVHDDETQRIWLDPRSFTTRGERDQQRVWDLLDEFRP